MTRAFLELRDLSCLFGVCRPALVILLRLNGAPYFVLRHDFRAVVSGRQSQISSFCLGSLAVNCSFSDTRDESLRLL